MKLLFITHRIPLRFKTNPNLFNLMMKKLSLIFLTSLFLPAYLFAACTPFFTSDIDANGDTVCMGVVINFADASTMNGTITTTQWNFGDGSPIDNSATPSHAYIQAGTYTVTFTVASTGCTGQVFQDTIYVIDPPTLQSGGTDPSCYDVCDGEARVFITGVHNNYHIMWDDPDMQNNDTATGLCYEIDLLFQAFVSDDYGCSVQSPTVILSQPDSLIANAGSDIYTCVGSNPLQIQASVSGGTGPYTYNWEPGTGLSDIDIEDPILTPNANSFGPFFFSVIDNNGCVAVTDVVDVKEMGATIMGRVENGLGAGIESKVTLYKVDAENQQWITVDEFTSADGNYMFDSVPLNDVIIYATPLITSSGYLPMYYGLPNDTADWTGAQHIGPLTCGMVLPPKNITLPSVTPPAGNCTFEGYVYLVCPVGVACKTQTTDPIPLIDVVVKKTPPGNAIAFTQTETSAGDEGKFTFTGIEPVETDTVYIFSVNIPGLEMQDPTYEIQVDIDDVLFNNLNFYVDTTPGTGGIFTYDPLGIDPLTRERNEMLAFPNPFDDNCELRFANNKNANFNFALFDVTGKLISRADDQTGNLYLLKTQNLDQGIYIAEVKTGDEVFRTRVMKK